MNFELELLFVRLRWPVAATRWWVMQELANLLVTPGVADEVQTRLLKELRECRLEAEALEVLSIFWMAFHKGWAAPQELGDALSRPSMLADRLLGDMKVSSQAVATPPLHVAPTDFEVSEEFERRQGTDVPRIHYSTIKWMEKRFGFPLVRQMAYEWARSKEAYPDAPFQGDLAHFARPTGGAGCFADRTSMRMLTAFIRTLEVAKALWQAPAQLAFGVVLRALPLVPTLAFLRPERPTWLPALVPEAAADVDSICGFVGGADVALRAMDLQVALIALATPLHVSNHEVTVLTVVRWRRWGSKAVEPSELWGRYASRQHRAYGDFDAGEWGLQSLISSLPLEEVIDEEVDAAPMAALLDTEVIGYLQRELYPERLYLPVVTGQADELVAEPSGGKLAIKSSDVEVASQQYWNAGWSTGHPSGSSGLVGTALIGRADWPRGEDEAAPDGHFYLWRLSRLKREHGYGDYEEEAPLFGIIDL